MREVVAERAPSASVWKASKHRLVGGPLAPDYIEATPDALWTRSDPFETYSLAGEHGARSKPSPHETFAKLEDLTLTLDRIEEMTLGVDITDKQRNQFHRAVKFDEKRKLFHQAIQVFADLYGLLGLFREEFGAPLLPEREVGISVHVAPDTVIDRHGKLCMIDPATKGKRLLEELMYEHDRRMSAERGMPPPSPGDYSFEPDGLILPGELRFQKRSADFMRTRFSRLSFDGNHERLFTYEDVQRQYGVRVVFDPQGAATGVSLVSTREPVSMWRLQLYRVPSVPGSLYRESLNLHLKDVWPLVVAGEDGRDAGSWYCPSLLKAIYLMRYLDLDAGVELQKCQAPGCLEYFRVGPRDRESLYCPPPPGKKQSKCASRASSAMYRERQRERRKSDTT